jgi:hypothetical protein
MATRCRKVEMRQQAQLDSTKRRRSRVFLSWHRIETRLTGISLATYRSSILLWNINERMF